ncbi:MAG: Gfo/Idh/MocA family oxidoreductase [Anaerolineae bacterium]|nr:Gfo/Idh/MocA family oxidoreductase [Anaerolineae bacterium]
MADLVRFGIIGCGEIGQSLGGTDTYSGIGAFHARYIAETDGAELVAVADIKERNARALSEQYGLRRYYTDYHDLLARPDVDVVNICTPSGTHGEIAVAAARAGKHVIVEKPMEVTLEKADAIIAECARAGVKLQVVMPHRFGKGMRKARAALESGELGKVILGNAVCRRYRTQEYYTDSSWRGTWAFDGGGALMNQGIHIIDSFLYLVGDASSVYGRMETLGHAGIEVEDTAVAVVKLRSGALGMIEGTTCAYPDFGDRIEIHAEKGTMVLEGLPPRLVVWEPMDWTKRLDLSQFEEDQREYYGHKYIIEDMVGAIVDDRQPQVHGQEGRRALELICAIYDSARKGREVDVRG